MKPGFIAFAASALAISFVTLHSSTALAEAPPTTPKVTIALRSGYALGLGEAYKDHKMSDGVAGQVPIWLDAGFRVIPNLSVGGYFQYGFGMLGSKSKDDCDQLKASCSASDIRFGGFVRGHFDTPSVRPYVGLGFGYEILGLSQSASGTTIDGSFKGLEFANLHGGVDFMVTPALGIGPFVSFSLGQYSTGTLTGPSSTGKTVSVTGDIEEKSMHMWLFLGLGGSINL